MTDSSGPRPDTLRDGPGEDWPDSLQDRRQALGRLAYLIVGDHAMARAAVEDAVLERPSTPDEEALAVVRQSLARQELVDRSRDDDFWRGGAWALQRLPADQRVLVALSICLGLDDAEVATLLDTSGRTVRCRIATGRTALAGQLRIHRDDRVALDAAVLRIAARHHAPDDPPTADLSPPVGLPASGPGDGPGRTHRPRRRGLWVAAALTVVAGVAGTVVAWPSGGDGVQVVAADPEPGTRTDSPGPRATTTGPQPGPTAPAPTGSPSTTRAGSSTAADADPSPARSTRRTSASTRPTGTRSPSRTASRTPKPTRTTSKPPVPEVPAGLLRGRPSGRCVDAGGAAPAAGTQLRLADCTGGAPQVVGAGAGTTLTLAGQCLDAFNNGTSPGTAVVVWPCHGEPNQQWTWLSGGRIKGAESGLCIAPDSAARAAGTPLVLAPCGAGDETGWQRT